jgi:hypothetical protein
MVCLTGEFAEKFQQPEREARVWRDALDGRIG